MDKETIHVNCQLNIHAVLLFNVCRCSIENPASINPSVLSKH